MAIVCFYIQKNFSCGSWETLWVLFMTRLARTRTPPLLAEASYAPHPYAVHTERPHTTSEVYQWHGVDCFLQKHNWWVFHNQIINSHNQLTVYQYYINLSSKEVFVSEKLHEKLLPILSSVTFRIFSGHRCILNLPYVLRIRVVICRSPSHQPSTSHHCEPL